MKVVGNLMLANGMYEVRLSPDQEAKEAIQAYNPSLSNLEDVEMKKMLLTQGVWVLDSLEDVDRHKRRLTEFLTRAFTAKRLELGMSFTIIGNMT